MKGWFRGVGFGVWCWGLVLEFGVGVWCWGLVLGFGFGGWSSGFGFRGLLWGFGFEVWLWFSSHLARLEEPQVAQEGAPLADAHRCGRVKNI